MTGLIHRRQLVQPELGNMPRRSDKSSKAIRVTGRGSLQVCEALKIPHCLDNRHIDGGEAGRLMHRQRFTPQKHLLAISGAHFSWKLGKPHRLVGLEGVGN
jgi:hypothetical protein